MGLNFAGGGYAYTEANISDSPALRLEDVENEMSSWVFRYTRTFELLEKSARVDLTQGYHKGRWTGQLDGQPASTKREGWTDSIARLAVNLYGAPPLEGDDKDDRKENVVWGLSAGYPITRYFGVKVGYFGTRALANTGIDFDSFIAAASFLW